MILGVFLARTHREETLVGITDGPWISLSSPNYSTHSEPVRDSTSSKKPQLWCARS